MSISDTFIKRPVLSTVLALLILLLGFQGMFNMQTRQYPEVDETVITVTTVYPGASPELIRASSPRRYPPRSRPPMVSTM